MTSRRGRLAARIQEQVRTYLDAPDGELLAVTAPPGSGKSTAVAQLGMARELAYIAERHDLVDSIDVLPYYQHIRSPSAENCSHYQVHALLADKGFNTLGWHAEHGCAYSRQFGKEGSTLYMVEHAPTPHVAKHQGGVIVDELNLPKWLPEHQFTQADLRAACVAVPAGSDEERLLRAVDDALLDAARQAGNSPYPSPLYGRTFFAALNARCGEQLAALVDHLVQAGGDDALNVRRKLTPDVLTRPETVAPNVLPHLLGALSRELPAWQRHRHEGQSGPDHQPDEQNQDSRDGDWNGCVRLAVVRPQGKVHKKEWVLGVTERRRVHADASPARVLLDATADGETLRRLFGVPVHVVGDEVTPPPHMRQVHFSVRYNLTSMRTRHGRDRARAIAQVRYLLRELNPTGDKRVGLITFDDCISKMGEALDIPEEYQGHFWAERGSNQKADCDILVVVGTPVLAPDEVARLARALYQDDPLPIDARSELVDGRRRYVDARMRWLSEVLTNAELTQCAHRNRPLWHDGRVVVTLCQGDIAFLPVTDCIDSMPQLDEDGTPTYARREAERDDKLGQAYADLLARTEKPTVANLRKAKGLGQNVVAEWLRQHKADEQAEDTDEVTDDD